jgi:hypothetical protein
VGIDKRQNGSTSNKKLHPFVKYFKSVLRFSPPPAGLGARLAALCCVVTSVEHLFNFKAFYGSPPEALPPCASRALTLIHFAAKMHRKEVQIKSEMKCPSENRKDVAGGSVATRNAARTLSAHCRNRLSLPAEQMA